MNLNLLFDMQRELDKRIEMKHELQNESLIERKLLALLVEIGELANETRCFKFWSLKPPSEKKIILEEYVDGLHFLLSIGIELNMTAVNIPSPEPSKEDLTTQFLMIYEDISRFKNNRSKEHYIQLFHRYLNLGVSLHFTMDDVYHAYVSKNEVNHERQNQGY
ncbi:dUTP diphosphatase [Bacillus sp. FJAT-47783]|uniref:dUTP diphosphatase n=1 Tax=Bacillus sp. FJAT-47783 TaxID=2922712 RepID=UPI001FAD3923|nr:dUTP diphosphatase [Bacillus sp. FJAT-47783]